MAGITAARALANAGSTGNNTGLSASVTGPNTKICALFVVEAIGATPTVTYKFQGTLDPDYVADGSANWFDLAVIQAGSDTATAAPAAVTALGGTPNWLSLSHIRFLRRIRVVTSLNTNVTYRCELHQQYVN